jgi:hypothetical protein
MLHRLRSVKARSLQDKYDINWEVVLGEGAYGAVYPGKLRSTGEKASKAGGECALGTQSLLAKFMLIPC